MKIVIVGAGVSGLSTYLLLQRLLPPILHDKKVEFLIYDSHIPVAGEAVIGNTSILPPSSLRILHTISPELYDLFKSQGFDNHEFTIRTARGHTLARLSTDDHSLPKEYAVSCPHWVLKACLREIVGRHGQPIHEGKAVGVETGREGQRSIVEFEDGHQVEADLIIGSDGVHSVVKRALFGEADEKEYAPEFEGYCGVGSFIEPEVMPEIVTKRSSVVVTFGPTGSFGYASVAPHAARKLGWWSNWPTNEHPPPSRTAAEVQTHLKQRHGSWKDPVIQKCISSSSTDCVYPLWTTPKLPHWGERGCVLLGDAAHTLQATSGQGAAQALEDSVTFSLLLAHHLSKPVRDTSSAIEASIAGLYELRHERVANIKLQARNLYFGRRKISNIWWEYTYYCFLFLVTNFPGLGRWLIGNSFTEDTCKNWIPEIEVERYVRNKQ